MPVTRRPQADIDRDFAYWKQMVDGCVVADAGLSCDDLPDAPYYDWWKSGVKPSRAAKRIILRAKMNL